MAQGIEGLLPPNLQTAPVPAKPEEKFSINLPGLSDLLKKIGGQVSEYGKSKSQGIQIPQGAQTSERPRVANAQNVNLTAAPLRGIRLSPQVYSQIAARYKGGV